MTDERIAELAAGVVELYPSITGEWKTEFIADIETALRTAVAEARIAGHNGTVESMQIQLEDAVAEAVKERTEGMVRAANSCRETSPGYARNEDDVIDEIIAAIRNLTPPA